MRGRNAIERAMHAVLIVIIPEGTQLPFQIDRIPEEYAIQILTADRGDEPLDERMRNRNVPNCLDFLDLKHPQIGQPAVKAK